MAAPPDGAGMTLYDPDPKHLWNRLHLALHVRVMVPDGEREPPQYAAQTFDPNDLDPFFWYRHDPYYREHPYLLSGPAYREALALLDEFLDKQGEGLVKDSLKRAILQRDLWTMFDWAADPDWTKLDEKKQFVNERRELQTRLGRVIPRLALSAKEIEQLPDNYAAAVKAERYPAEFHADRKTAAFLPADLWDPKGSWVLLGDSGGGPLAGGHVQFFGGRSTFMVFVRLPEGRDQTLKYLEQVSDWRKKGAEGDSPQFPPNTAVALARRTVLLDDRGEIRLTPLTEKVQLRILHDPTTAGQPGADLPRIPAPPRAAPGGEGGGIGRRSRRRRRVGSPVFLGSGRLRLRENSDHGFVPQLSQQRLGGPVDAQFRAEFAPVQRE